jgi:C-terminal processing protease CtpA/Prc
MNKLTALLLLFVYSSYAQEVPQYEFIKVWNFLKYYHPDLASGKIDADSLFLDNILRSQLDINTSVALLSEKLDNNFTIKAQPNSQKDVIYTNQNFDWYQKHKVIKHKYKKLLNDIYTYRFVGDHYYDTSQKEYQESILHEKTYDLDKKIQMPLKYRLLTMAKIIGAIDYLYPYKYLMPNKTNERLKELVQQSITCASRKEFEIVLAKAVALLEDTHAFSFYKELHYRKEIFHTNYFSPFDYQVREDHILVTHLIFPEICKQANIAVGDRIMTINGTTVAEMITNKKSLLSASNTNVLLYKLSNYLDNLIWTDDLQTKQMQIQKYPDLKEMTTQIELISVENQSQIAQISAYLTEEMKAKNAYTLEHENVAYFRIDQTMSFLEDVTDDQLIATMDSVFEKASAKKAIVFDMRAYPDNGGFAFTFVYNYFAPKENWYSKYYKQNFNDFGTYVFVSERDLTTEYFPEIPNKTTHTYNGKVFIIVNAATQSMSEWNTMNFQHVFPQAVTIGEQTAGADGDMKRLPLPGGYIFGFTGNVILYPDNTLTQKVGIQIDEVINYTDTDIIEQRDIPFERILNAVK